MYRDLPLSFFNRVIGPIPVVLISVGYLKGKRSIMPCTSVAPISLTPPYIGVSVAKTRYTCKLIRELGDFVVNVPTWNLTKLIAELGIVSGSEVDKFEQFNLTPLKAKKVKSLRVGEAIAWIECCVEKSLSVGDRVFYISRVVAVYAREECSYNFGVRWFSEKPVLYLGDLLFATGFTEYYQCCGVVYRR